MITKVFIGSILVGLAGVALYTVDVDPTGRWNWAPTVGLGLALVGAAMAVLVFLLHYSNHDAQVSGYGSEEHHSCDDGRRFVCHGGSEGCFSGSPRYCGAA